MTDIDQALESYSHNTQLRENLQLCSIGSPSEGESTLGEKRRQMVSLRESKWRHNLSKKIVTDHWNTEQANEILGSAIYCDSRRRCEK